MMCRLALAWCLVAAGAVQAAAQDPTQTLPDAYKLQLDNDHVRVVRVHYGAGAKLPDHTHAGGTTVYVYLNDSDGVVFRHSGRSNRAVTRPAVKTGSVRVASGGEEHHTAENPAATPSDFLRIWLKTEGSGERTMRRLSPTDEQFENKQLRITRIIRRDGKLPQVSAPAGTPSLVVLLPGGDVHWLPAGRSLDTPAAELLRIDLLTSPK